MKEKFNINISKKEKTDALVKGIKKSSREIELEEGGGSYLIKGGPHKNKKKYNRKKKHKNKKIE